MQRAISSRRALLPKSSRGLSSVAADWAFPVPVTFGAGRAAELPAKLRERGSNRPLLVADKGLSGTPVVGWLFDSLAAAGLQPRLFGEVDANPTDLNIVAGAAAYREHAADGLVAVGGGSGLDAGKSIAMVAGSGRSLDELEWTRPPVEEMSCPPLVLIPTTAGTGAEMDSASMYTDTSRRVKFCVAHPGCTAQIHVIADPLLTLSLPPTLTAWTGMDAVTHAIEALSVDSYHPMCDGIALESLRLMHAWLPAAVADGSDVAARSHMLAASAMAAVAFQKGLGAVHGLSEPVGAVHNSQHGLTNAILLPHVLRANRAAIGPKMDLAATYLGLPPPPPGYATTDGGFERVAAWLDTLAEQLQIPATLAEIGISDETAEECAAKAVANPTGFTNPLPFDAEMYSGVFRAAVEGRDRGRLQ